MKKLLHFRLLVIWLILSSNLVFAQVAPTLGVAGDFVLFSSIGAVSNVGISKITGNVGTNSGLSTGFGNINGQMHDGDAVSAAAASSLNTAYLAIGGQLATVFPAVLLGGQTFTPAVIQVSGPSSIIGNLTLNGLGNPNAVFVIKLNGAFSMASGSKILLINGAKACNVFWKVEGLTTIATGASLVGNFIVNGAIVLGSGAQLEGRALSIVGAVTVTGVKASAPLGCGSIVLNGPLMPSVGKTGCYALLTSIGALTSTGTTRIVGDIGTNNGPLSGFNPLFVTGAIHAVPDASTIAASADLGVLYTYLNTLPFDIQLLYPAQFGNSQVLTPHTYRMIGAAALTDTIFLDALGNPNAVFVIQINGALTTSTYAKVILKGGTKASNVFWKIEGLVTMGTYTTFQGTVVANNAAIVMNIGDSLIGRGLSTNGAITANSVYVGITSIGSSITPGSSLNFCMGDSVILTAGASTSYKWSRGDTTQSIKVFTSGTHYVITNGCAGPDTSANIVVTVAPLPIALITPAGISSICIGDSVILKTRDSIGYTYQWQKDTVNIMGAIDSFYIAKTVGNYTVKVTNGVGCFKKSPIKVINVSPFPTSVISNIGSLTFCQGDSVKLSSDTISGLFRQWKKDGINILGANDTFYYAKVSGNYTLQVGNTGSCFSISNTKTVTVNQFPLVTITTLTPTTFCVGDSVKLRTNSSSGLTYIWKKDGINIPLAIDSIYTAKISGSYAVTISNGTGCNSTSIPTIVNAVPFPGAAVTLSGLPTFCQGDSVLLSTSVGSGLTYQWKNGSTAIFGATNATLLVKQSGTYSVSVSNSTNCTSNSNPIIILVNPLPSAVITTNDPTIFCEGDSVRLSANKGIGFTYQWYKNNGIITNAIDSYYVAKADANYSVTITNLNNCKNTSAPITIKVNPIPLAVITASGPVTFCFGGSVTLTANLEYSYRWSNNDTTRNINVSNSGPYFVTVTSIFGCKNVSSVTTVTVNPLPLAATGPDQTIIRGGSVLIGAAAVSGNSYLWTPAIGLSSAFASQPMANPMDTTTYILTETIDLTGCSTTNSVTVNVVYDIEFFNGFSPNGDGINDYWNIPILGYYPENGVIINNRWGSEVWKANNYNNKNIAFTGQNMNGDELPDGTYFYILSYNNTEKRGWVIIKR